MRGLALARLAGEISLKSDQVRKRFLKTLSRNMKAALKEHNIKVHDLKSQGGRAFIYPEKEGEEEKISRIIAQVFGVHSTAQAIEVELREGSELEKISELALKLAGSFLEGSFAVRARREGKHSFTSKQVEERVGADIVQKLGLKVNLSKPDNTVFIEVRSRKAFLYTSLFKGRNGLPLGVEGKIAFISGQEEQAREKAACFLALKRGCDIIFFTEKDPQKTRKLIESLKEYSYGSENKSYSLSQLSIKMEEENIQAILSAKTINDSSQALEETRKDNSSEILILRPLAMLPKEREEEVIALR